MRSSRLKHLFQALHYRLLRPVYQCLITPRWRGIFAQYYTGQISEIDIELFRHLENCDGDNSDGLVIDAGANCGQFALSMLSVNRTLKVLSFEPNPALRWSLLLVTLLHPMRFRFRMRGLGEQRQSLTLHVPVTTQMDLSSNASLDSSEFNKDYVQERLTGYSQRAGGRYGFRQRQARIIPLDELRLSPLAIKIDVEGWELQTLRGMQQTIERCHPLLMIEINNQHRFMPWLQAMGYAFYVFDAQQQRLLASDSGGDHLNIFAIHPQMPAALDEQIKPLLSAESCATDQ